MVKVKLEVECPSPDSNGNPFVALFATKDWEWIAGNSS